MFFILSIPGLGCTQPPIQGLLGVFPLGEEAARTFKLHPYSAEVKNGWTYILFLQWGNSKTYVCIFSTPTSARLYGVVRN
jgi:hypothetical protein